MNFSHISRFKILGCDKNKEDFKTEAQEIFTNTLLELEGEEFDIL